MGKSYTARVSYLDPFTLIHDLPVDDSAEAGCEGKRRGWQVAVPILVHVYNWQVTNQYTWCNGYIAWTAGTRMSVLQKHDPAVVYIGIVAYRN